MKASPTSMIDHRLSGGRIQRLAAITLLALLYYTTARLGLTMEAVSGFATLVWPPTGISLAALLILGYRVWPGIFIGALFANLAVGASIPLAVSIGVGNTCEALLGAYLLTRVPGFRNSLERLRDVVGLIFFAAVLSTMVSATVGVANLWVGGVVPPSDVGRTWVAWWVGDAIGDLIVAPVFLVWSALPRIRFRIWRVVEAALLGAVVLITTLTVFGWLFRPDLHNYIPPYFIFPVLIWVSLRFGQRGGVTATLAVSVIAVWCTALGFGPFQSELLSDRLLKLQTFMGVVSMSTLLLAAVITERRKAEEASRESKERYRNLVENIREVYYISDRDGKLVYGSPNLFRESGYQERELIGQSYVRLIAPQDRRRVVDYYLTCAREGTVDAMCEFRVRLKDGRSMWVEQSTRIIRNEEGEVVEYRNVVRDIGGRKEAEEHLQRTRAQLENILDSLDQTAFWSFDVRANILLYNSSGMEKIYHRPRRAFFEDLQLWKQVVHPEDLPLVEATELETIQGKPARIEYRIIRPNGEVRWVDEQTIPVFDAQDMFIRLDGVIVDITARKRTEEAIRESELRYRTLVESMNEGLLQVDNDDAIQFVNKRFCDMVGYSREELIGKVSLEIFLREEDRDFIREQNRRRTHNISGRYEIQLRKKSGEFIWVQISASPVSNAEGAVVGSIGVFTDITDRKRSEEALRVSEARFESLFDEVPDRSELPQPVRHASDDASAATISDLAQKINQVTDTLHNRVRQVLSFSSLASHELKTPLAIVRSQLENVMRPHVSAHILRKVLTSTYDEILRLNHTVGDLLSLGTMLAGTLKMNRERVEFLAALNDFYEEATLLCWEKEITIELEKGPEVFTELDVARFRQVLFNLLENSIKHTPPKGKISLRYRTQDHQVVFEFADTGSGIPKDQLARIFYPFAQASSERKDINGAGLGLALVIRIVEAHHGSIRVESEEGRGTTFTIRLPMHRSTPGQTA